MTEKERMEAGLIYDSTDKELVRGQNEDIKLLFEYNKLRNDQTERMEELLRLMFAEVGEGSYIQTEREFHHGHTSGGALASCESPPVQPGHPRRL